tara:strand:- start:1497 stop:4802 length:3306 start_codon:yes stop_codon:yes gene_type:complete
MNKEDAYNIKNYSDDDLYNILDLINPSDRELEAKINSNILKYSNIDNSESIQLSNFFKDVYEHFFDLDDENDDSEYEEILEESVKKEIPEKASDIVENREISYNVDLDYSKGTLNPLLKQTTKRIVSIDSKYRDDKSSLTSDFTFNLADPLKDVVSLRLYSIQIPYTWYTINNNYGSNFFIIKGNKPGIDDGNHDLKVEIPIGNYTAVDLITSVSESLQSLKTNSQFNDIEFGSTDISYNYANSKATLNIEISKHYNENQYNILFSNWSTPSNAILRKNSIPGFLGFNRPNYFGYRIYSNLETISTNEQSNLNINIIDNSNNFIRIINYVSTNNSELINSITNNIQSNTSINYPSDITILDDFSISLNNGTYTRINLLNEINNKLQTNSNLFNESKLELVDETEPNIVGSGFKHYVLDIRLNRNNTKNRKNSKILVILPNDNRIWTGSTSLFVFDNYKYELSNIISESKAVLENFDISDNEIYNSVSGPRIEFICNKQGFDLSNNNFTISLSNGSYSLNDYISNINTSIQTMNNNSINNENLNGVFNLSNTRAFINSQSRFELNVDLNKTFNENNFNIDFRNSIFNNKSSDFPVNSILDNSFDLSQNNIFDLSFNINADGYLLTENDNLFTLNSKINDGLDVSYNVVVTETSRKNSLSELQRFLNNIILNFNDGVSQIFKGTKITILQEGNIAKLRIEIKMNKFLTENDYRYVFVGDSWITSFKLLETDISNNITIQDNKDFFSITGNNSVSSNNIEINNTNNIIKLIPNTSSNNNSPSFGLDSTTNSNELTLTLTNGTYDRNSLILHINNILSSQTTPNNDSIGINTLFIIDDNDFVKIKLNINKSYTAKDYKVVFYDPLSFITYTIGNNIVTSTTWDATLGWILGFRISTEYFLEDFIPNNNIYSIIGDNVVSVSIYSYYLIILDDYNQNHLNGGIVTSTQKESNISLPSYVKKSGQVRDPNTNEVILTTLKKNGQRMTKNEIYAAQEILDSKSTIQNEAIITTNNSLSARTVQYFSKGPFAKNVFALLPLKISGLQNNSIYVDYGGTLQNQERTYFGPVNINRMTVKLMNDKGELVDLNGANWSFSFICEQLYQKKQT